jgi:hypothetical protein
VLPHCCGNTAAAGPASESDKARSRLQTVET